MALVPATLTNAILACMQQARAKTDNPAAADQAFAEGLAAAIDTYIKTATVVSVPALSNSAGPVVGTIVNTIQ